MDNNDKLRMKSALIQAIDGYNLYLVIDEVSTPIGMRHVMLISEFVKDGRSEITDFFLTQSGWENFKKVVGSS